MQAYCPSMYSTITQGSYRSGKTGKSQRIWLVSESQGKIGKIFFLEKSGKLTNPGTKSFETVRAGCLDSLIEVQLHFILSIAKMPATILDAVSGGQAHDAFLVSDLLQLVKDLLSRFVKRDVIDSLVTCHDVTSFDTNHAAKHNSAVDMGFSADRIIRSEGFKKKKVSDRNMLGFRTDAKSVIWHRFWSLAYQCS